MLLYLVFYNTFENIMSSIVNLLLSSLKNSILEKKIVKALCGYCSELDNEILDLFV